MKKVTLIPGDGIGKEISESLEQVFAVLNAPIEFEKVNAGYEHFLETGSAINDYVYE